MPNIAKIYTDATKVPKESDTDKPLDVPHEEDAAHYQARQNWLRSDITKEYKEALEKEMAELLNLAVTYAVTYPQHKNVDQIIHALVRVDIINKILKSYASR